MPLIIPANSITGGYEVANSLRFDDGSSDNLSRTFSTPTSGTTWTISFWVKKTTNGSALNLCSRLVDGSNEDRIRFTSGDALEWSVYKSGGYAGRLVTNRLFRDNSAWYNIICVWATTNGTGGDRMRMYVNGVEETSFSTDTNPSLNETSNFNASGSNHRIGSVTSGEYFDGYMAEVVMIDGTAVSDATSFGEFDEDTGIWKPISVSGLTFGTNGFYLDFENSGSLGADVSGNGNNFTVNNLTSIDQTTDTPTNNYATLNSNFYHSSITFSEGNLKVVESSDNWRSAYSNLGVSKGKWYWEARISYQTNNEAYIGVAHEEHINGLATYGIGNGPQSSGYDYIGNSTRSFGIFSNGNQDYPSTTTYTGAFNDATYTMGVALDMDNLKMYLSRNGVWTNASNNGYDSSTFNSSTGAMDISGKILATGFVFPAFSPNQSTWEVNFGSPSFSISSGNSDGNGYGNFEYSVPSGYYALNTKNLAEFG